MPGNPAPGQRLLGLVAALCHLGKMSQHGNTAYRSSQGRGGAHLSSGPVSASADAAAALDWSLLLRLSSGLPVLPEASWWQQSTSAVIGGVGQRWRTGVAGLCLTAASCQGCSFFPGLPGGFHSGWVLRWLGGSGLGPLHLFALLPGLALWGSAV